MDEIRNYPNVKNILFSSKSKKKSPTCDITGFIMILITPRLISYKVITILIDETDTDEDKIEKEKLTTFLATNEENIPLIFNNVNWISFPLKE